MPKLDRWIVASKMVEVFDRDTLKTLVQLGGQFGGGWCQVHQHICVNARNKEKIETLLAEKGYTVLPVSESKISYPSCHAHRSMEATGETP